MKEEFKVFPYGRWEITDKGFYRKGERICFREIKAVILNETTGYANYIDVVDTNGNSAWLWFSSNKDGDRGKKVLAYAKQMVELVKDAQTDNEEFYLYCKANGVADLESEANKARLLLLAEKWEISKETAATAFSEGKNGVEDRAYAAANAERLKELKQAEEEQERLNVQFKDCRGREKYIKHCRLMCEAYREKIRELESGIRETDKRAAIAYNSNRQKEHDWALHGGAASAIAGGAAGAVVTANIQQKNAQIRAYNDKLRSSISTLSLYAELDSLRELNAVRSALKMYEDECEKAAVLLVEDRPAEELQKRLNLSVDEVILSETKAVLVSVSLQQPVDLVIYGDVPAFIDGVFRAVLKTNGTVAGEAFLAIPYTGAKTVVGICPRVTAPAASYEVELEPLYLTAIEKTGVMKY